MKNFEAINIIIDLIYVNYKISKIKKPIVSIFGGKSWNPKSPYYKQAFNLGKNLIKENISILTGGGPGIMQAACMGAKSGLKNSKNKKQRIMGIKVKGIDENAKQSCPNNIIVHSFCIRKRFLIDYSSAFIIFPGGIGTADELFETANLIKTKKNKAAPIILLGSDFWNPMLNWYNKKVIKNKLIPEKFNQLFLVFDRIEDALNIITHSLKKDL